MNVGSDRAQLVAPIVYGGRCKRSCVVCVGICNKGIDPRKMSTSRFGDKAYFCHKNHTYLPLSFFIVLILWAVFCRGDTGPPFSYSGMWDGTVHNFFS